MRGEEILRGEGNGHGSPGGSVKHGIIGTTAGDSWLMDGRESQKETWYFYDCDRTGGRWDVAMDILLRQSAD